MELSKFIRKREGSKDSSEDKINYTKYALTILKASVFAVLLTVVLFLLAALVLLISGVDDEVVPLIVQVVRIVSIGCA